MKKLFYLVPLGLVAACSNNSKDSASIEEPVEPTEVKVDTAEIALGQEVYFDNLEDGQEVTSPVTIKMGVKGMEVEPATNGVNENKGHHHLMIDTMSYFAPGTLIPMVDDRIIHFGAGQTEHTIELSPGKHKIAMQFANGVHNSYGVRMSKSITIIVK